MKTIVRTIVSVVLVIVSLIPSSFVMAKRDTNPSIPDWVPCPSVHAKAFLIDNRSHEKVDVPVKIRHKKNAIVLEFTILSFSSSRSSSELDAGLGMRGTITMYYAEKIIGNTTYHAIDRYTAKWEKYDTQYTLSNAFVTMGVSGVAESGQRISDSSTSIIGTPTSGTVYTRTAWWMPQYFVKYDEIYAQSGLMQNTITRGGSSWTFSTCIGVGQAADC